MKVNVYLLPLDILGNSLMVSTAQPAEGIVEFWDALV